jgi:hypothetical protein
MLMSLQQAKFIKKGSAGIEAVTLGQNPWFDERLVSQHIALPTCARPAFVSQNLLSTSLSSADATCPPGLAITIYEHLSHTALKVSRATSSGNLPNLLGAPCLDLSLARHNGDIVGHVAMKHARDAHAVITVPAESTDASSELQEPAAPPSERGLDWEEQEAQREHMRALPLIETFLGREFLHTVFGAWRRQRSRAVGTVWNSSRHTWLMPSKNMGGMQQVLESQRVLEYFYESRVGATERLVGFMVLFHRMVSVTSRVPYLGFAMDRTESRLRIASTPAPVPMRG